MQRLFAAIAASATALAISNAAETMVTIDDVPEPVLETAIATAPGAVFDRISIEIENGVTVYEFESKDAAGRHIEIDVLEDGTLDEIELETTLNETPLAVREAMKKTAPGFEPTYIEASVRADGSYIYELEGVYQGSEVDMEITEDGRVLFLSDDNLS
ncbi:MAG: hypothetical protein AAGA09_02090 [Pseudomonadota bacterium]